MIFLPLCDWFLLRFQSLSVERSGGALCRRSSVNKLSNYGLGAGAGLGADISHTVCPWKDQKRVCLKHRKGTKKRKKLTSVSNSCVFAALCWTFPSSLRATRWSCGGLTLMDVNLFTCCQSEGFRTNFSSWTQGQRSELKQQTLCIHVFISAVIPWVILGFSQPCYQYLCCRFISVQWNWSRSRSPALQVSAFISVSTTNQFSSKAPTGSRLTPSRTRSLLLCESVDLLFSNSVRWGEESDFLICSPVWGTCCSRQWTWTWTHWGCGEVEFMSRTCSTASVMNWGSWYWWIKSYVYEIKIEMFREKKF